MPVTLADIARELGVSKMTVSRAINNDPRVSHETRERVLEVARRLNYHPNQYARALATNRSYMIGVVVPDLMHSYFAEIWRGIESVARPVGYRNLICNTDEDAAKEMDEAEALLPRTDGLIVASSLPPRKAAFYRRLIKEGAKVVFIDRKLEGLRCPVVTTDDVQVGMLATEHLINLGHRRVGHLRGTAASTAAGRFEGYRRALARHRLPFDESLVRDCGFTEREGYDAMRAWLAAGSVPGAIFAVNDPTAIGAMQALEEAGLRVGRDAALVGGGNIHYADMLRVPLTTVSWSRSDMGREAARLLLRLVEGKQTQAGKAEQVVLPPELIVRSSCGAKPVPRSGVRAAARAGGYSVKE
jgi:LacI family transcriptional regulator